MIKDCLKVVTCLRDIRVLVERGHCAHLRNDDRGLARASTALKVQVQRLADLWPGDPHVNISHLERHVHFGEQRDYVDMSERDLPGLESQISEYIADYETEKIGFQHLLHPNVVKHCIRHYENGAYAEAVLNGMKALSHAIRTKVKLDKDGADLINDAFKLDAPLLVFSEIDTQTGKDDQAGFHLIMLGAFRGIRNPKAHELTSDLTEKSAAQYLVFISLLLRRVDEASRRRTGKTRRVKPKTKKRQ